MNVTTVTASSMFPRSSFQECDRSHLLRMLLQSPRSQSLHCYCCHRYKNVTAAAASRILLPSPLQERYRGHRYKNLSTSLLVGVHSHTHTLFGVSCWYNFIIHQHDHDSGSLVFSSLGGRHRLSEHEESSSLDRLSISSCHPYTVPVFWCQNPISWR